MGESVCSTYSHGNQVILDISEESFLLAAIPLVLVGEIPLARLAASFAEHAHDGWE